MKSIAVFFMLLFVSLWGGQNMAYGVAQQGTTLQPDTKAVHSAALPYGQPACIKADHAQALDNLLADFDDNDDLTRKLASLMQCLLAFTFVFLLYFSSKHYKERLTFATPFAFSATQRLSHLRIFRI